EASTGVTKRPLGDARVSRAPEAATTAAARAARSRRVLRARGGIAAGAAALVGLLALAVGRAGSPADGEKISDEKPGLRPQGAATEAPVAAQPTVTGEGALATTSAAPV